LTWFLLLTWACPALCAEREHDFAKWEREIAAFEQGDRSNSPPKGGVLFIGSSTIRLWKTLAQDFPKHRVVNRGFGGSEIADSVRYFDPLVLPTQPRQIVLYAGGNDIDAGKTPEEVFSAFRAFADKVRTALPRTQLAYISIAPNPARWAQVDRVMATNRLISDYARHHARKASLREEQSIGRIFPGGLSSGHDDNSTIR